MKPTIRNRKKKLFLSNLKEAKGIISIACERTGISRRAYYDWCEKDEAFDKACEDIREYVIDIVESQLLLGIKNNDMTGIIFYLKTKAKHRGYVEKTETELVGNPFEALMKMATADNEK